MPKSKNKTAGVLNQRWRDAAGNEKLITFGTTPVTPTEPEPGDSTAEVLAGIGDAVENLTENTVSRTEFSQAQTDLKALMEKAEAEQKAAEEKLTKLTSDYNRSQAIVTAPPGGKIEVIDPYEGNKGYAYFCSHIHYASKNRAMPQQWNDNLRQYAEKTKTFASGTVNEAIDSEGGFLVPTQQSNEFLKIAVESSELLKRVRTLPIERNSLEIPYLNVTSLASQGIAGGLTVAWGAEASTIAASQQEYGKLKMTLHKLQALAAVSSEILDDSPMTIATLIREGFGAAVQWELERTLIRGTGAGQPLGILAANATQSVVIETGQTAETGLEPKNIWKMWSLMYAPLRANGIWMINQSLEPQLFDLTQAVGTGGVPVYLPANGLSGAPFGTLLGRPVIPSQHASAANAVGDLMFIDPAQYLYVSKGEKFAQSIHLYFDTDREAFRLTVRADGQPWWPQGITDAQSNDTLTPFVTLAVRA